MRERYPKPGPVGGRLIRQAIATLRMAGLPLPIASDILIATSGGSDSVALAVLLVRYGRRVVDPSRISLLHLNHGWRGTESDADAQSVQKLARQLGVKARVLKIRARAAKGESPEAVARAKRAAVFARHSGPVFTAHHADDLAETLLWRLFTGGAEFHPQGIKVAWQNQLRPLLKIRKRELQAFLREEGIAWREDATNHEGKLLRSRMRQRLMPELEKIFPRAIEHLVTQALSTRMEPTPDDKKRSAAVEQALFSKGIQLRKSHRQAVRQAIQRGGEVHLPDSWTVKIERTQSLTSRNKKEKD